MNNDKDVKPSNKCPCCGEEPDWIKYWGHNSLAKVLRAFSTFLENEQAEQHDKKSAGTTSPSSEQLLSKETLDKMNKLNEKVWYETKGFRRINNRDSICNPPSSC